MRSFYCSTSKLLTIITFILVVAVSIPTKSAQALDAVTVVGGPGSNAEVATSKINGGILGLEKTLLGKEFGFDQVAWAVARAAVQSITQSIINWINSGFQGSPAFVQDLEQHLLNIADQTAGNFIYNDPALNFLCSPFQLDVKIALATAYRESQNFAEEAQCTLTDVTNNVDGFINGSFQEGGWSSWFELTQNPVNTPTGAYLAAETEMYARIVDEQGQAIEELSWGDGFLSFKVCADTDVASGAVSSGDCDIVTPGATIADQLNEALGAGQRQLIEADEINEIISALFAQLAQQALGGMNGLLGLGSQGYTDASLTQGFPSANPGGGANNSGGTSYLEALAQENTAIELQGDFDPLLDAIATEREFASLASTSVRAINNIEAKVNAHNAIEDCRDVAFPSSLRNMRRDLQDSYVLANTNLELLQLMRTAFTEATSVEEQSDILNQFQQLQSDGTLHDEVDVVTTQLQLDFDIADARTQINSQISLASIGCEPDDESNESEGR